MRNYLSDHLQNYYLPESEFSPGFRIYNNRYGWKDYYLGQYLIYSHRTTTYDMSFFPEKIHTHSFFEMDIFCGGHISYIVSDHEVFPQRGDILLVPPGVLHTARQMERSEYDRFVFYFDSRAFEILSANCLPIVLKKSEPKCLAIENAQRSQFHYLTEQLDYVVSQRDSDTALLALSYIIQLFHLIGYASHAVNDRFSKLPPNILQIKTYIDQNFQNITTMTEIADTFFYSREYVSRMFKQYFNTNISEYMTAKKLEAAKQHLEAGESVTQAFLASGYRSMSAFVNAFRANTSQQPSAYRKSHFTQNE